MLLRYTDYIQLYVIENLWWNSKSDWNNKKNTKLLSRSWIISAILYFVKFIPYIPYIYFYLFLDLAWSPTFLQRFMRRLVNEYFKYMKHIYSRHGGIQKIFPLSYIPQKALRSHFIFPKTYLAFFVALVPVYSSPFRLPNKLLPFSLSA